VIAARGSDDDAASEELRKGIAQERPYSKSRAGEGHRWTRRPTGSKRRIWRGVEHSHRFQKQEWQGEPESVSQDDWDGCRIDGASFGLADAECTSPL